MKKAMGILLMTAIIFFLSAVAVFAEAAVIGSLKGSVGAVGDEWGDYASGDSIEIGKSGDVVGYEFKDVKAGVYKVALYITVEELGEGKQIRVSPRVGDLRCWIDWATTQESRDPMPISAVMDEEDTDKIILVSVINVPEDGMTVNVGWWQDEGAIIGTCDKVVLATADYDFGKDTDYTLVNEKDYRGNDGTPDKADTVTSYNEDPDQKLLPAEGSWTASTSGPSDTNTTASPENTPEPIQTTTVEPTAEPTVAATQTATATVNPSPTGTHAGISTSNNDTFPTWAIVLIVIIVLAAAGAAYYFLVMKREK